MKTQHTPGPWNSVGVRVYHDWKSADDLKSTFVASCAANHDYMPMAKQESNARLIAAAPDLLTAAQDCLADLQHYVATHGSGPDKRLAALVAAINKATQP